MNCPLGTVGNGFCHQKMHKQEPKTYNLNLRLIGGTMKFNKWTVGLASAGVVSMASVVQADEKPNMVQTMLDSTMLSGYVDTSAQWNFGTGNERLPAYKFG